MAQFRSTKTNTLYMRKGADGLLHWESGNRAIRDAWVKGLKVGQVIEVQLQKLRSHKSNPQLRYWHSVLLSCASEAFLDAGYNTLRQYAVGIKTTEESVDLALKGFYQIHINAERLPMKRDMTLDEMSELIDFSIAWLAENLGAIVPLPDERDATDDTESTTEGATTCLATTK